MPSVHDYTVSGEEVTVSTTALDSDDPSDTHKKGRIACTNNRVIFSREKYVADISLRSVNSIEYEPDAYNRQYIAVGIIGVAIAVLSQVVGPSLVDESAVLNAISVLSGAIGAVLLGVGLLLERHKLSIHTPSKSYRFSSTSSELEDVAHAIRGHEP